LENNRMTHFDMVDDLPVHDETDSTIVLSDFTIAETETARDPV